MEIWYKAYWDNVKEVEVVKSTDKTITLNEKGYKGRYRIRRITSEGDYYARTREDAKAMLVDYYQKARDLAQSRLDYAESNLRAAKEL